MTSAEETPWGLRTAFLAPNLLAEVLLDFDLKTEEGRERKEKTSI